MDMQLDSVLDAVVDAERGAHYMESTIGQTKIAIRAMKSFAAERGQSEYTKEFGAEFASLTTSPKTGKFSLRRKRLFGRLSRLCDSYIETGTVDLSVAKRARQATFSSAEFAEVHRAWTVDMDARGLARNTKDYYGRLAAEYLGYLERSGIASLSGAGPETILGFLMHLRSGSWSGTSMHHLVTNFRPFIKYLGREDLLAAFSAVRAKRRAKILPVLEAAEQEAIASACCSGEVSRRDAAVTLLCMTTGIRACDVIELRLGDIDWVGGRILTVQKKTGNPLDVPLLPAVGNALCDYVLGERPRVGDDHVFLCALAPYRPFADHATVYNIIRRVQRAAGLEGCPCGTRAMRHNAASQMVRSGAQLPTISAVLGQADPSSTDIYITVDEEGLRRCVLPIPGKGGRDA